MGTCPFLRQEKRVPLLPMLIVEQYLSNLDLVMMRPEKDADPMWARRHRRDEERLELRKETGVTRSECRCARVLSEQGAAEDLPR